MLSVRATGDFAPAFAYVTVYEISLSLINFSISSLYVPVIAFGVMLIPVTESFTFTLYFSVYLVYFIVILKI